MENQDKAPARWSQAQLLAFRFAFVYLILFYLPFPFGAFPYRVEPRKNTNHSGRGLCPRLAGHVLHLSHEI